MQAKINVSKIGRSIRKNWFNLIVLFLLLFVFLKKDLTFSFNIASPDKVEKVLPKPESKEKPQKNREFLSDKTAAAPEQKSTLNIMGFSFGNGADDKSRRLEVLKNADVQVIQAFIKRFSHVAENEQHKYGIPASVILANAIYLSGAGTIPESQELNNYFAIGCTKNWQGMTGEVNGKCLRKYESAWAGFRDHSMYLTSGDFVQLKSLGDKDHQGWCQGMERLDFVKDDGYAEELGKIIRQYNLYEFDD